MSCEHDICYTCLNKFVITDTQTIFEFKWFKCQRNISGSEMYLLDEILYDKGHLHGLTWD